PGAEPVIVVGAPIAGTDALVRDGELCVGGAGLARGYLGRPGLTAERFVPHPERPGERLYRTGDAAAWRSDCMLEVFGRLDNQVKIRGHRVELEEVEAVLRQHPAVADAAVSAAGEGGDRRLLAHVVPAVDEGGARGALRDSWLEIVAGTVAGERPAD